MKKSQRLRLTALLAKDAATLSAAEKSELATLQALAAQHTDASKDTDDAVKLSPAQFLAKLSAAFTDKQALAAEVAAEKAKVADLTAKLATATAEKDTAAAAHAAAVTAKTEVETKVTALTATLASFATAIGLKPEELAGKSAAEMQAAFNSRVVAHTTDKLAELGFPLSGLPSIAAPDANAGSDKVLSYEAFSKLSPTGKQNFFRAGGQLSSVKLIGPFAAVVSGNN